jgi:hypothetical protein
MKAMKLDSIQAPGHAGEPLESSIRTGSMAAVRRMNMRNLTVLALSVTFAACGGGGGGAGGAGGAGASTPASVSAPQSVATPPSTSAADLSLADRIYKGTQRTPDGFAVEARPSSVSGTLSTRHLKNTDFATGPQAISPTYEVCTNDMAQAIEWSESQANWNGQYSDMSEVHGDSHMWEVVRVPRADVTAMLRHRVFRCDYLDRTNTDLRADAGAAGSMNQRPLTAGELGSLAEYLWQFTMFNNSDSAVASSSDSSSGSSIVHSIRIGQLVRGATGTCDTVQIVDWTHTMDSTTGALTRSLANVRTYKAKNTAGATELCAS